MLKLKDFSLAAAGVVLHRVSILMAELGVSRVAFSPRRSNQVAHELAHIVSSINFGHVWASNFPN